MIPTNPAAYARRALIEWVAFALGVQPGTVRAAMRYGRMSIWPSPSEIKALAEAVQVRGPKQRRADGTFLPLKSRAKADPLTDRRKLRKHYPAHNELGHYERSPASKLPPVVAYPFQRARPKRMRKPTT